MEEEKGELTRMEALLQGMEGRELLRGGRFLSMYFFGGKYKCSFCVLQFHMFNGREGYRQGRRQILPNFASLQNSLQKFFCALKGDRRDLNL